MSSLPLAFDPVGHRVLLTGGHGFIGRRVADVLLALGADVLSPDRRSLDVRDAEAFKAYVLAHEPVAMVHLAGVVGGAAWLHDNDERIRQDGEAMQEALAAAVRGTSVERVLGVGSTAAYGPDTPRPFRERDLHAYDVPERIQGYARSKRDLAMMLADMSNLSTGLAMLCNVYGPGQRTDAARANVIGAVATKLLDATRDGRSAVPCHGANAYREFVYVDDCANGIVDALQRLGAGEAVNIGCGEAVSIRHLTESLAELCGYSGALEWRDLDAPEDVVHSSCEFARSCLDWTPTMDLHDGLKETVRMMQEERRTA